MQRCCRRGRFFIRVLWPRQYRLRQVGVLPCSLFAFFCLFSSLATRDLRFPYLLRPSTSDHPAASAPAAKLRAAEMECRSSSTPPPPPPPLLTPLSTQPNPISRPREFINTSLMKYFTSSFDLAGSMITVGPYGTNSRRILMIFTINLSFLKKIFPLNEY
jgi:hypothetical protein